MVQEASFKPVQCHGGLGGRGQGRLWGNSGLNVSAFGSLGCGIGYGYLHRIPTQPPSHHKKPPSASPPGPTTQDSPALPGPETGSRQGDYVEVWGEHLPAGEEEGSVWAEGLPAGERGDSAGCPHQEPLQGPSSGSWWEQVAPPGTVIPTWFSCHLGLQVRVVVSYWLSVLFNG